MTSRPLPPLRDVLHTAYCCVVRSLIRGYINSLLGLCALCVWRLYLFCICTATAALSSSSFPPTPCRGIHTSPSLMSVYHYALYFNSNRSQQTEIRLCLRALSAKQKITCAHYRNREPSVLFPCVMLAGERTRALTNRLKCNRQRYFVQLSLTLGRGGKREKASDVKPDRIKPAGVRTPIELRQYRI